MDIVKAFYKLCILLIGLLLIPTFVSAEDLVVDANTTWVSGQYTYDNVIVTNGATLTFNGAVTLNATNLTIDTGSSISADGKGYGAGSGPGAGRGGYYAGGGGYGGKGGDGISPRDYGGLGGVSYGSAITPVDLGSGGGNGYGSTGGSGGGTIRLNIIDTLTLNGKITSNGSNGGINSGGGSGGSIYVTTRVLSGSGDISANGGNSGVGNGGGGGGGRIAIYYNSSAFPQDNAIARGGAGYNNGGDGTVGFFDTLNNNFYVYEMWRFQENDSPFNFNTITLTNGSGTTTSGNVSLASGSLTVSDGSTLTLSGQETLNVNDIIVSGNSVITHSSEGNIYLNVPNLTIDTGSSISADGKGYGAGAGPGGGRGGYYAGGGGYGGIGGDGISPRDYGGLGGVSYGSAITPVDLGSGGGNGYGGSGGSGGGIIRLNITDTLTLNGKITSNGSNGGINSGGGSGGSIYVTTRVLSGSGDISANGGNSGVGNGGGGGGGRIAIYYNSSAFPQDNAIARGGSGYNNGGDGTVIIQGSSSDTSLTFFTLIEKSSTTSTFSESFLRQGVTLNNVTVSGDLNGTLDFTKFEIVNITTGSFAGKGFSKGEFAANLENLSYKGYWNGMVYLVPSENKIYIKGAISGDMSGIAEGFLTESIPDSGVYDKYQATWRLNRLGTETISTTINFEGILSYQSSSLFTSEVYLYQANMEGSAYGYYTGPMSAVITHLRLTSENEYQGNGFSIISHNSNLGSGEGWTYNQLTSPDRVEFKGLFKEPLIGKLSAFLEEARTPKTLSGTIERLDLGLPPQPDLKVRIWNPQRVSPGETINYIIELRNDGLKAAENITLLVQVPVLSDFISASTNDIYYPVLHMLRWDLSNIIPKSYHNFYFQVRIEWGLVEGTGLSSWVYLLPKDKADLNLQYFETE